MSREGDLVRRALKRHLIPALSAIGFSGRSSEFQRLLGESQDLLCIQYWKNGGSFVLEFGRRERGPLHTTWGEVFPEDKVTVAHLPTVARARLEDRSAESGDLFFGFQFAGFGEDRPRYDALAQRVAALLPQVDAWLQTRDVGPDVRPYSDAKPLAQPDPLRQAA
jgi:hypothetical protein